MLIFMQASKIFAINPILSLKLCFFAVSCHFAEDSNLRKCTNEGIKQRAVLSIRLFLNWLTSAGAYALVVFKVCCFPVIPLKIHKKVSMSCF